MSISEATYYNWKKKYGGLGVPELRRLKQLEEENQHLKQLVADLSLDKQMLQDVLKKSSEARAVSPRGSTPHRRLSHFGPPGLPSYWLTAR
jgi:putative transposase